MMAVYTHSIYVGSLDKSVSYVRIPNEAWFMTNKEFKLSQIAE